MNCACGCGQPVSIKKARPDRPNAFVQGHHMRNRAGSGKSSAQRRRDWLAGRRRRLIAACGDRCHECDEQYEDGDVYYFTQPEGVTLPIRSFGGGNLGLSWPSLVAAAKQCRMLCQECFENRPSPLTNRIVPARRRNYYHTYYY